MGRQVSKQRRLAEEDAETVREDYVKKMRDNYPLIVRTLMHDIIVSIDKEANFVFLNDAAVEFLGKSSDELIGANFTEYLHPEDVGKAMGILQELVGGKEDQVEGFIIRVKSPKGFRTLAMNGIAVFDSEGNYIGAHATGRDLTDLMRTEEELKQSRSQFRRLFEVIVDPLVIVDMTGKILEFSQSAEEILGSPREELVGKRFLETKVAKADTKAVMVKNLERMKKGRYISPYAIEAVTKGGKKLFYEVNPARIVYKGEPAILAIFRNLTEQKKAEEKLQESEERFNYFLENAPEAIWVQDLIGTFLDGNKQAEELTGYKKEDLLGKNMLEILVPPESIPRLMEAFKPNKHGKISGPTELEMIRKDGSMVSVEASTIPIARDGKIEIIGITRDITERKKAEEALKESEKRFRELSDLLPEIVFETDATGKLTFVNQIAFDRFGYSQEDFDKGLKTFQMLIPEDRDRAKNEIDRVLSGTDIGFTEYTGLRKDGSTFPIMIHSTPIIRENMPVGLRGIIVDITDRKKAEGKLRESEKRFKSLIDNAPDAIWLQDTHGIFVDGNKRAEEITGYDRNELIGKNMLEVNLVPEKYVPVVLEALATIQVGERSDETELELIRKDGSLVSVETSAIPVERDGEIEVIGIARDVTERKKQEELLRRARKKFETYFDLAKVMLIAIDAKGNVTQINKKGCEVLGYKKEQILGKNWFNTFLPKRLEKETKAYFRKLLSGQIELAEYNENPVLTKAGKERLIAWHNIRIRDEQGNIKGTLSSGQDITERKKAEEALKESEKKYREMINAMNDTALVLDFDTNIIDANQTAVDVLGYSREELLSMKVQELDPSLTAEYIKDLDKKMKDSGLLVFETSHTTKDGKTFPVEISATHVTYQGKSAILSIARDITERKKAREALMQSEKRFRALSELLPEVIFEIDLNGAITFVNRCAFDLFGFSEQDLEKGLNLIELLTPQDQKKARDNLGRILSGEKLGATEYTGVRKDGSTFPCISHCAAIIKENKPVGIRGIIVDITDRKRAEDALRISEKEARRLLEFQNKVIDTATVWVNLIDLKGNVILWNRAAELVSGYSRKEIIGTNKMWKLLYPDPDYRAKIFSIGKEITKEGKQIEDYYSTIKCKDGSLKTISWYSTNILDEKGEPAGSISIGIDVTEREKAQQAINNALSLLRQSNKELESYTYVVSHDLKAPLRTIRSFGSFILEDYEDKLDETGKDYLNRMINASSHLDSMIEDLLVLSRVGRKFTELEKVDLNELLKEILADLEATIKERNAKILVDKLPALKIHRVWKRQLFTNLISNALKFNESKTPKIEVLYEERETDHLFKVRDNGIGIEEKYLERIFNLFERAPTDKKYEGTGAGLAICKKIVEQFGGKIWVESTPGKGSTFFFTIPKELKQTKEA